MTPETIKLLGTIATVILLLFGGWLWAFRVVLTSTTRHIETAINQLVDETKRLERRIDEQQKAHLEFKAHVAEEYFRRDDFVRFSTEVSRKLDRNLRIVEEIRAETSTHVKHRDGAA